MKTLHDCPHCACLITPSIDQSLNEKISAKSKELFDWCIQTRAYVSPDKFVRAETAAKILDHSPGTLRNWRTQNMPLPCRQVVGRWQYKLDDLAAMLLLNE